MEVYFDIDFEIKWNEIDVPNRSIDRHPIQNLFWRFFSLDYDQQTFKIDLSVCVPVHAWISVCVCPMNMFTAVYLCDLRERERERK